MELPGGDPKEMFAKVAEELKAKFDECGMGAVQTFTDDLDKVAKTVQDGPAAVIERMQGAIEGLKTKVEALMDDPQSLAPSGSALANCAGWYGKSVCKKLKTFQGDVEALVENVKGMLGDLMEPLKNLQETLSKAMATLEDTVKKLAKLPDEVKGLAESINGPEDVAQVDTESMKKSLDVSKIAEPLDLLKGLKEPLKKAVETVKNGIQRILDFIKDAPVLIEKAFAVPVPCCCCQKMWLSQAPAAATQLMGLVESMKALDLSPVSAGFESISSTICDLDTEKVTKPVNDFAEKAQDPVDSLDKAVSAAKLASGGGGLLSAAKDMVGGLF